MYIITKCKVTFITKKDPRSALIHHFWIWKSLRGWYQQSAYFTMHIRRIYFLKSFWKRHLGATQNRAIDRFCSQNLKIVTAKLLKGLQYFDSHIINFSFWDSRDIIDNVRRGSLQGLLGHNRAQKSFY